MKKNLLNFCLMSLLFLGVSLMLSSASFAQKPQVVTGSIKHETWSVAGSSCTSVQLLVSYIYNGNGYTQITTSQTLAAGSTGNFSTTIPGSATNVVKSYKITMSSGWRIHNFATNPYYSYSEADPGFCGGGENDLYTQVVSNVNTYWLDL